MTEQTQTPPTVQDVNLYMKATKLHEQINEHIRNFGIKDWEWVKESLAKDNKEDAETALNQILPQLHPECKEWWDKTYDPIRLYGEKPEKKKPETKPMTLKDLGFIGVIAIVFLTLGLIKSLFFE